VLQYEFCSDLNDAAVRSILSSSGWLSLQSRLQVCAMYVEFNTLNAMKVKCNAFVNILWWLTDESLGTFAWVYTLAPVFLAPVCKGACPFLWLYCNFSTRVALYACAPVYDFLFALDCPCVWMLLFVCHGANWNVGMCIPAEDFNIALNPIFSLSSPSHTRTLSIVLTLSPTPANPPTHIHQPTRTYSPTHSRMQTHTYTLKHTRTHAHTCIGTCTHKHTHTSTHIRAWTYTCTQAHMHTYFKIWTRERQSRLRPLPLRWQLCDKHTTLFVEKRREM